MRITVLSEKIDAWMSKNNCQDYLSYHQDQLDYDFSKFDKIDLDSADKIYEDMKAGPGHGYAVCKYTVKDNEIHRSCAGQHTGFRMFSDEYLTTLARMFKLPDIEFMQNLGDWPLSFKNPTRHQRSEFPIVSWCGSDQNYDLVLPTYDYTRTVLQANTYSDFFFFESTNDNHPWDEKYDKAI